MTTPRDDIAGLIERLRRTADPFWHHTHDEVIDEAATQLDSLLKERDALRNEINDWANEVARYKSYAEKFDQENAALQARVKELEVEVAEEEQRGDEATRRATDLARRALRAEQERDEAYERLKALGKFVNKIVPLSSDPHRLAVTEKDGE